MDFKLILTADYEHDYNCAIDYIAYSLFSPIAARNLSVKLDRGKSVYFSLYHDEKISSYGFRFAAVNNYLLFYRVDEAQKIIYVTHLFNGRQNIQKMI